MTDDTTMRTVKGTVGDGQDDGPATARVGCATPKFIVEKTAVSPSGEPSADDCYPNLLHISGHDLGLSCSVIASSLHATEYRVAQVLASGVSLGIPTANPSV